MSQNEWKAFHEGKDVHNKCDNCQQPQTELDKYKIALTAISSAKDSFATIKSCVQVAKEALKENKPTVK